MRVLKEDELDRVVRMCEETEGVRPLCGWVPCVGRECEGCLIDEYYNEAEKRFPDGMTYDEAFQFLEDK